MPCHGVTGLLLLRKVLVLNTNLERLGLMESMAKRLVKAVGPKDKRPLMVGWDFTDAGSEWGLPAHQDGYGLIFLLARPGKKHVTLAGDRAYVRMIAQAWLDASLTGEGAGFSFEPFTLRREGWEPEWPVKADAAAWSPVALSKAGA